MSSSLFRFSRARSAGYGRPFGLVGRPTYPNKVRFHSRVIEFDPVTLHLVWKYKRPSPAPGESHRFFCFYISSPQRISIGNTLITEGDTGRIFEVTPSGELVWEYLAPYHDYAPDTLGGIFQCAADTYRAYGIPYDYIPSRFDR